MSDNMAVAGGRGRGAVPTSRGFPRGLQERGSCGGAGGGLGEAK